MAEFPTIDGVTVFRLPPDDYEVNFDNRAQHHTALAQYLIVAIGIPLAFIALCQRYYTKFFLSKGLQTDDCMQCPAIP